MNNGRGDSPLFQRWEELYKDALFEADMHKMPRRIELAKHAILDRLEDANCARNKRSVQTGELAALRNAHRSLRLLEQLYSMEIPAREIRASWSLKSPCRSRAGLCLANFGHGRITSLCQSTTRLSRQCANLSRR
jgi:hypothetical protein